MERLAVVYKIVQEQEGKGAGLMAVFDMKVEVAIVQVAQKVPSRGLMCAVG